MREPRHEVDTGERATETAENRQQKDYFHARLKWTKAASIRAAPLCGG